MDPSSGSAARTTGNSELNSHACPTAVLSLHVLAIPYGVLSGAFQDSSSATEHGDLGSRSVEEAIQLYDKDHSGEISFDELAQLMVHLRRTSGFTKEEIQHATEVSLSCLVASAFRPLPEWTAATYTAES